MKTSNNSKNKNEVLVRAKGLTKLFGEHKAVDNIDFDIHRGEIVGFLGPNGAGKTTTIRMLLNLLNPNQGDLSIFGLNFSSHRAAILRQMNASSGSVTLPGKLSVHETLAVFADMYGIANTKKRIETLLDKFELTNLNKRPLYGLSTGQQVRVALAKAFLNKPKLLLLDEPTSSLDPDVADRVRTYLTTIVAQEKTTVFLTSHNMREVETVCSRVLFLNQGKIRAEGSPSELARRVKRWKVHLKTKPALTNIPQFKFPADTDVLLENGELIIEIEKNQIGPLLTTIVEKGSSIETVSIKEPTLEDFFVHSARTSQ